MELMRREKMRKMIDEIKELKKYFKHVKTCKLCSNPYGTDKFKEDFPFECPTCRKKQLKERKINHEKR